MSFFGGFGCLGVVGGHFVEVTKVKKIRLNVRRRPVTTRVLGSLWGKVLGWMWKGDMVYKEVSDSLVREIYKEMN